MEHYEELSIAEMDESVLLDLKIPFESKYAISHHVYGKTFNPGVVQVGLNYERLCGYLDGAILGKKANLDIFLYNGISNIARNGFFPNIEFHSLSEKDLEGILEESNIHKKFNGKVRRV